MVRKVAPPEDDKLPGFSDAEPVAGKTRIPGDGLRRRWKDRKGHIYEWDYKRGVVEKYNKRGDQHLGEYDPYDGRQIKGPIKTRKVEP